ncbi:dihydroneopterin aldolase [Oceaniglobus ichthyenteri]|uniref:dihydroneopterin aldolase n=1 Tax=Oceaniglobus ichthyenteri TaxID=2136177 RepID=UPI000D3DA3F4|nr:dihydroneopterin aldolase [Oceaniglobus ichthyenteri]
MTSDVTQAFGHPEMRARATGSARLADRISLRDHIVTVEIGAFQQERGTTQRVCFNLVVEVADHDGASDDDVDKILSYDTLTDAIAAELAAERLNLLETLADRIAKRILTQPQAQRCFVRIEKLDRGPGALGVEIVRERADAPEVAANPDSDLHPVVVYLSQAALAAPHLSKWIAQLDELPSPVVLCVDLPQGTVPTSDQTMAQRRIDLLAIEQNAWVLAGRDPRCVVVQTRTELDWAMKNKALTVWAPSKLVLDSVDRPDVVLRDSPALAAWFAGQMQAERLIVIGDHTGQQAHCPVYRHDPTDAVLPTD